MQPTYRNYLDPQMIDDAVEDCERAFGIARNGDVPRVRPVSLEVLQERCNMLADWLKAALIEEGMERVIYMRKPDQMFSDQEYPVILVHEMAHAYTRYMCNGMAPIKYIDEGISQNVANQPPYKQMSIDSAALDELEVWGSSKDKGGDENWRYGMSFKAVELVGLKNVLACIAQLADKHKGNSVEFQAVSSEAVRQLVISKLAE